MTDADVVQALEEIDRPAIYHDSRIYLNRDCTIWTDVSPIDYAWLSRWSWSAHYDQRGKIYARRLKYRCPVYMHIAIMERTRIRRPSPEHRYVDHRDNDGVNNRRENLRWATASMNAKNTERLLGIQNYVSRREMEAVMRETGVGAARSRLR